MEECDSVREEGDGERGKGEVKGKSVKGSEEGKEKEMG